MNKKIIDYKVKKDKKNQKNTHLQLNRIIRIMIMNYYLKHMQYMAKFVKYLEFNHGVMSVIHSSSILRQNFGYSHKGPYIMKFYKRTSRQCVTSHILSFSD